MATSGKGYGLTGLLRGRGRGNTLVKQSIGGVTQVIVDDLLFSPDAGGPTNYTLTATAGSYSLTGGSAVLTKASGATAYTLTANAGSYALTGGTASLKVGRKITANAGTYALFGGTASLKVGRKITANAGTYSLTGSSATLTKASGATAYSLTANPGTYAVSGGSASLKVGRKIAALGGSYSLTGGAATLKVSRSISALGGSYSLNGGQAVLTKTLASGTAYTLTASPGIYLVTGGDATLSLSPAQVGYSAEVNLSRKWYVKRGKKLHIFANAKDADEFLEAESTANDAIERAKTTSRQAKRRIKQRVIRAIEHQTVDIDLLGQLASRYAIPIDIPALIAQQDYMQLVAMSLLAQQMADEDDIEMLLLM